MVSSVHSIFKLNIIKEDISSDGTSSVIWLKQENDFVCNALHWLFIEQVSLDDVVL